MKHLVHDHLVNQVVDGRVYHICLNEDCQVVYFNLDDHLVFKQEDVKISIWFKKDADPKYICYCNQVTEQQIIEAVLDHGAKSLKDVVKLTGAMKKCQCERNNPLGKCCTPLIEETIQKAKLIGM